MINIETLIPPSPKRSAAQMSRGIGVYKRAGDVFGPAGVLIEDEDSERHRARAEERRFRHASRGTAPWAA